MRQKQPQSEWDRYICMCIWYIQCCHRNLIICMYICRLPCIKLWFQRATALHMHETAALLIEPCWWSKSQGRHSVEGQLAVGRPEVHKISIGLGRIDRSSHRLVRRSNAELWWSCGSESDALALAWRSFHFQHEQVLFVRPAPLYSSNYLFGQLLSKVYICVGDPRSMHPVLSLFILLSLFTGTRIYMPVDNQARIYMPCRFARIRRIWKKRTTCMAWQARKTHLTLPPTIVYAWNADPSCCMHHAVRARYAVPVPAGGRDTACSSAI